MKMAPLTPEQKLVKQVARSPKKTALLQTVLAIQTDVLPAMVATERKIKARITAEVAAREAAVQTAIEQDRAIRRTQALADNAVRMAEESLKTHRDQQFAASIQIMNASRHTQEGGEA
jgi:hypothetical protein